MAEAGNGEEEAIKQADAVALQQLALHFPATAADLPKLEGEPSNQQKCLLANIWHFCKAAPFGHLPAVTFDMLGVPASFVHTLVGDKVWEGYWGDQHPNITGAHWIPTTLLPILKHIADVKATEHAQATIAEPPSVARFNAAVASAAKRRTRGTPY